MPIGAIWDGWRATEWLAFLGLPLSLLSLIVAIFGLYLPEQRARRADMETLRRTLDDRVDTRVDGRLPPLLRDHAADAIDGEIGKRFEQITRVRDQLQQLADDIAATSATVGGLAPLASRVDVLEDLLGRLQPAVEAMVAEASMMGRMQRMALPIIDRDWCSRALAVCEQADSEQRRAHLASLGIELVRRYQWAINDAALVYPRTIVIADLPLARIVELSLAESGSAAGDGDQLDRFQVKLQVLCITNIIDRVCHLAKGDPEHFADLLVGLCRRWVADHIVKVVEPHALG